MRARLVIAALAVTALAAAHGCTLPLDGIPTEGSGGRGGATGTTSSAGGASTSGTTGASSSVSTGPGPQCTVDAECPAGTTCETPICAQGTCGFETASHDAMPCAAPASECFDSSACMAGACVPRPKPQGTTLDDGIPGNCTSIACDGAGNSSQVADGSDPPPDDDPADCKVPSCNGTTPTTKSKSNLAACGTFLQFCWGGTCVDCQLNSQCPDSPDGCATPTCSFGQCSLPPAGDDTPCQVSGGGNGSCLGGACCPSSRVCNGMCCAAGKSCKNGMCHP